MTVVVAKPLQKESLDSITRILAGELLTAMGCTEPIAIAYCGALAARALGKPAEGLSVRCSGNIIKNAKSVVVPNTLGLKGIQASAIAGVYYGDAEKGLEVLSAITPGQAGDIARKARRLQVPVSLLHSKHLLHIVVACSANGDWAEAEICGNHTHIAAIRRNGQTLYKGVEFSEQGSSQAEALTVRKILCYARQVSLEDIKPILIGQIKNNIAIAKEGLSGSWGAEIGKTVLAARGDSPRAKLVAWTAAGSDARMNGCAMPVTINSGSGNQGLTASIPVIIRAEQLLAGEEILLRALAVSNLIAIHQKEGIGRLSAYCGAVTAAIGSAAGIAFLEGADDGQIDQVISNGLMIASGMLCDGAKSSCAAKIVTSLDSALLAYDMTKSGRRFQPGEGLAKPGVERTISAVARVAREGMRETDVQVLNAMLENTEEELEADNRF